MDQYDREFTKDRAGQARVRMGYSSDEGSITEFVLQLEYFHDGEWREVVRFDHNPNREMGHDVTMEGVHMDVYRDGDKIRTEEVFPPMEADEALNYAEVHLGEHAERYINRYQEWHEINSR